MTLITVVLPAQTYDVADGQTTNVTSITNAGGTVTKNGTGTLAVSGTINLSGADGIAGGAGADAVEPVDEFDFGTAATSGSMGSPGTDGGQTNVNAGTLTATKIQANGGDGGAGGNGGAVGNTGDAANPVSGGPGGTGAKGGSISISAGTTATVTTVEMLGGNGGEGGAGGGLGGTAGDGGDGGIGGTIFISGTLNTNHISLVGGDPGDSPASPTSGNVGIAGSGGSIIISSGGILNLTGGADLLGGVLGGTQGTGGSISVASGGRLAWTGGTIDLSGSTNGTLDVTGTLATTESQLNSSLTGNLTLNAGATIQLTEAAVTYSDGATTSQTLISGLSSASRTVAIDNTLNITSDLDVGADGTLTAGTLDVQGATLAISGGGDVTATTAQLGFAPTNPNSIVTVTGSGSTFASSNLTIGTSAANNSATVSGGATGSSGNLFLGEFGGSDSNSFTVTGSGSQFTLSGRLDIGQNGDNNTLSVLDGATFEANAESNIGFHTENLPSTANSTGNSLIVDGAGSTFTTNGNILNVGLSGDTNSVTVSDGGSLATHLLYVGRNEAATSNRVTVTGSDGQGTDSKITTTSSFGVGVDGDNNTADVLLGGDVLAGAASYVGYGANSSGNKLTVDGAGSTFTVDGYSMTVGWSGDTNTLDLKNGGVVTSTGGFVGREATATGNIVNVTGTNSAWNNTGALTIGHASDPNANNVVNVDTGGTISTDSLVINRGANGNAFNLNSGGTLSVDGAFDAGTTGFTFNSGGTLVSTGALSNLGTIDSGKTVNIANGGSLGTATTLDGGALATGAFDLSSGNLTFTSGTLNASGELSNVGTIGSGKTVNVSSGGSFGTATTLDGGNLATGAFDFNSSNLNLTAGTVDSSGPLSNLGTIGSGLNVDIVNGGSLATATTLDGGALTTGAFNFTGGNLTFNSGTLDSRGALSNLGSLQAGRTVDISNGGSFATPTTLNGGTLKTQTIFGSIPNVNLTAESGATGTLEAEDFVAALTIHSGLTFDLTNSQPSFILGSSLEGGTLLTGDYDISGSPVIYYGTIRSSGQLSGLPTIFTALFVDIRNGGSLESGTDLNEGFLFATDIDFSNLTFTKGALEVEGALTGLNSLNAFGQVVTLKSSSTWSPSGDIDPGRVELYGGTLTVGNFNAANLFFQSGNINTTGALTNLATISANQSLNLNAGSSWTPTNSAFTGNVNLAGGTLSVGAFNAGQSGFTFTSGTLNASGALTNYTSAADHTLNLNSGSSWAAGTNPSLAGIVNINTGGSMTTTGSTGPTFAVDSNGALNLNSGGTLNVAGFNAGQNGFTFDSGGTLNATGTLTDVGTIGANQTVGLSGSGSFGSATTLAGGAVNVGDFNFTGGNLTFTSGTLNTTGALSNLNTLTANQSVSLDGGSATWSPTGNINAGQTSIDNGATLSVGALDATNLTFTDGTLNATGTLTDVGTIGADQTVGLSSSGSFAQVSAVNDLDGGTLNVGDFNFANNDLTFTSGTLNTTGALSNLDTLIPNQSVSLDGGSATWSPTGNINTGQTSLNNGATLNVGSLDATNLTFTSSTLNVAGNLTGYTPQFSQTLNLVSGGSWTTSDSVFVSTVNIEDGGDLTAHNTFITGTTTIKTGGTMTWTGSRGGSVFLEGGTLNVDGLTDGGGRGNFYSSEVPGNFTGTLNLSNANLLNYLNASNQTLNLNSDSVWDLGFGTRYLSENTIINVNHGGTMIGAPDITSASGELNINDGGVLVLTGGPSDLDSSSGGEFNLNSGGTLRVGDGGTSGGFNHNLTNNGNVTFDRSDDLSFGYAISGTGSLTKVGDNVLTLTGTNAYTGGTTISAGTLTLGHATDTLADTGAVSIAGGTLALGGNSDTVGAVSMSSGSITGTGTLTGSSYAFTNTGTVDANLAGTGALTKTGSDTVTLTGTNTYSGATNVNAGTLTIGAANALSPNTALNLTGGTLNVADFDASKLSTFTSGTITTSGALTNLNSLSAGQNVTLDGGSATWSPSGNIDSGKTSITNGATLSVGTLDADTNLTFTSGTLNVSGTVTLGVFINIDPGKTVNLLAGGAFAGFNHLDGGTVSVGDFNFTGGNLIFTSGTLNVTGTLENYDSRANQSVNLDSGSFWNAGNDPAVLGTIHINDGGSMTTTSTAGPVTTGTNGSILNLNSGGTLNVEGFHLGFNGAGFNFNGGTLNATGTLTDVGTIGASQTVDISGGGSFAGNNSLAGGTVNVGDFNFTGGNLTFTSGTLNVSGLLENYASVGGQTLNLNANGEWNAGENPNLAGIVNINDGGSLTTTGRTGPTLIDDINGTGQLYLNSGGTLNVEDFDASQMGLFTFEAPEAGSEAAILNVTGDLENLSDLSARQTVNLDGASATWSPIGSINDGNISIANGATLSVSDVAGFSASNLTFTSGTLNVSEGALTDYTSAANQTLNLNSSGSWNAGEDPSLAGIVNINANGSMTTTSSSPVDGGALNLNSGGTLNVSDFDADQNGFTFNSGGTLNVSGGAITDYTSAGGQILNLESNGSWAPATDPEIVGIVSINDGGSMTTTGDTGPTLSGDGSLNLNSGGTLNVADFDAGQNGFNFNSGTLRATGALSNLSGVTTDQTVQLDGAGASVDFTAAANLTGGTLSLDNGGTATIRSNLTATSDSGLTFGSGGGTIDLDSGLLNIASLSTALTLNANSSITGDGQIFGDLALGTGGTLNGDAANGGLTLFGNITGTGTVANTSIFGTVTVGNSPGHINYVNTTLNSGTIVNIAIEGAANGEFDTISIDATSNVAAATLNITFENYTPSVGATWALVTNSSGTTFSTINTPSGWTFNGTTLSAVPEPGSFAALVALLALGFTATRRRPRQ